MKKYLYIILYVFLFSCTQESKKDVVQIYPKDVVEFGLKDVYRNIKWGYYKYYQDCFVDMVSLSSYTIDSITQQKNFTILYSKPLIYHNVSENIFADTTYPYYDIIFRADKQRYKNDIYSSYNQCFRVKMGGPLYIFSVNKNTNKVERIEYQEYRYVEDTTWINEILYSPDEPFVEKLLEHQDSITPWLKNELILRGYIKK